MKKEFVFLALMALSMFLVTEAFSMEEEDLDSKPSFIKRVPVALAAIPEEQGAVAASVFVAKASSEIRHSIKETPVADLEALYFWAVSQGHLPHIRDPKFITLPRGSHSESVIGINPPDADSPQYVLKKLYGSSSQQEAQYLLELMNDPMFIKWNDEQRLQSGIKLLVNIPLAIYVNKDGASSRFIVVLNGAPGLPFHGEIDEYVLSGFAERLAELHYYTKRCHRDLGYPNIFYNLSTQTITFIDAVDLAVEIPVSQELEYTLGSPSYSSAYVEGDVRRICAQLSGSAMCSVKEQKFKKSYTRAMLKLDPKRGSEVLERFRIMWEVLVGELVRELNLGTPNPFDSILE